MLRDELESMTVAKEEAVQQAVVAANNEIVQLKETAGVYEVLDFHTEEAFPNVMEVLNHYKSGLGYYRDGKWDTAILAFQDGLKLHPEDKGTQIVYRALPAPQREPARGLERRLGDDFEIGCAEARGSRLSLP